ncbi:lysophospholipid acyltransferase family protein [Streptomyces sp. NPDC089919]|uniref:lysophospholipid acyltransferase family protein n=1 Tax=Streptomyces sp. NPDC089919 TaxID=3155188 RepID=UPI00343FD1CC
MSDAKADLIELLGAAGEELRHAGKLLGDAGEIAWDRLLDWFVDDYFRVDLLGLENVPAAGPAVLVANHSGAYGLDAFVLQKVLGRSLGRTVHYPAAPFLFRFPVLGSYARKNGAFPINPMVGMEHLAGGELVGVFPEGVSGLEKPMRERYRLRPFSPGFAVSALRAGAPVLPVALVGAEESVPRLGEVPALARLLDLPFFPVTPPFPLPAKWTVTIGEPIPAPARPESYAARAVAARDFSERAQAAVQELLDGELAGRETPFW